MIHLPVITLGRALLELCDDDVADELEPDSFHVSNKLGNNVAGEEEDEE